MNLTNQTTVCIASGCSLTDEDIHTVYQAQQANHCKVIAINNNFLRFPSADILYSADHTWWTHYKPQIDQSDFTGELWSQYGESLCTYEDVHTRNPYLNFILCERRKEGLPTQTDRIHFGGNSGYQAICLAYIKGASRIILLGYDMKPTNNQNHWHGNHPDEIDKHHILKYTQWINHMDLLAQDARAKNFNIINCTKDSALTCFPIADIKNINWNQ